MLGIGKHLNIRFAQRRSNRNRRKQPNAIIRIFILQDKRQVSLGLDNRLRLRPVARNSMPKILNPLPVIANTNQLLRHSLGDQIVTLCYQFFLHMSHVPATDPCQQIVLTPYCENLPSPVTMGIPLMSAVAIIILSAGSLWKSGRFAARSIISSLGGIAESP